jgi:hypothetical protein
MTMHANKKQFLAIFALLLILLPSVVLAAFVSGSTGTDGAFAPTADTVLQIPESGVFNFTTVTIPTDVTVTFTKNSQNTPVTILATGDVTINGTLNLNGADASNSIPGAGGPGGFDGGQRGLGNKSGKNGEGPGGALGGAPATGAGVGVCAGGAGYLLVGATGGTYITSAPGGTGGSAYGNERILPAIGGSGGGGGGGTSAYAGGAGGGGGGSLVIASSGAIAITGAITANGGNGSYGEQRIEGIYSYYGGGGGGGSGGSIRLLANTLSGNGTLSGIGGTGGMGYNGYIRGGTGSVGRIRFEAFTTVLYTGTTTPHTSLGYPNAVEPPDMPSLKITAIAGVSVPGVPSGSFIAPDVILPFNTRNPVTVTVTSAKIPVGQTVTVSALPSGGTGTSATGTLSGTDTAATADVALNISTAYPSLITATVTYELAAMNIKDFYIAGEKVERVRVATNLGGKSSVTYITATGREIPAEL